MYSSLFAGIFLALSFYNCQPARNTRASLSPPTQNNQKNITSPGKNAVIQTGADQTARYLPLLRGKNIAMVVNQTSVIGKTHLVDSLQRLEIKIKTIYAPEHGFRGEADAGAHISNGVDAKTGVPILSLYGKNKKPTADQLKNIDLVVFDIQDVGARFYTYISTMHYVMEACAEKNIPLLILDRPNPNGYYVDGPVLDPKYTSFVGMHPIPVVHGLTVGELARMINGQKWLANGRTCSLTVIPAAHYTHKMTYSLPVKPSPNLPNDLAIQVYPSICLFEGTNVSVGRGTPTPFQVLGSPFYQKKEFSFTPVSTPGATSPMHLNQVCYGYKLTENAVKGKFSLSFLLDFYQNSSQKEKFFNKFFTQLAGNTRLQEQITAGQTEEQIRASWEPALSQYKQMRKKYLLYPDFD